MVPAIRTAKSARRRARTVVKGPSAVAESVVARSSIALTVPLLSCPVQDIPVARPQSPSEMRKVPDLTRKSAEALWYVGAGRAEIRNEPLAEPGPGEVRIRTLHSGISRGTESLVLAGRVPPSEFERMRAPFMAGSFPFPVKYGYATVGRGEAGPAELRGRLVFALHPHQSLFNVPAEAVVPIPDRVPPARAVLAANMETALNAMWDARPAAADRIAVVE